MSSALDTEYGEEEGRGGSVSPARYALGIRAFSDRLAELFPTGHTQKHMCETEQSVFVVRERYIYRGRRLCGDLIR